MAKTGDLELATSGDFLMATDNPSSCWVHTGDPHRHCMHEPGARGGSSGDEAAGISPRRPPARQSARMAESSTGCGAGRSDQEGRDGAGPSIEAAYRPLRTAGAIGFARTSQAG